MICIRVARVYDMYCVLYIHTCTIQYLQHSTGKVAVFILAFYKKKKNSITSFLVNK